MLGKPGIRPRHEHPRFRLVMAAQVLHFGEDEYHRISILESAGYIVEQCASLSQLTIALKTKSDAAAVFLTENELVLPEDAASLARENTLAPVILFRTATISRSETAFDLVVPCLAAPDEWLCDVHALVACSREIRARSQALIERSVRLRLESSAVRKEFHQELERARRARAVGGVSVNPWQIDE